MTAVATFAPPSLQAQLDELRRERYMRDKVYPHMIASRKIDADKAAHNNRGLDGAIKTLETLVAAQGQPGRRQLIEALRAAVHAIEQGSECPQSVRDVFDSLGGAA